LRFLNKYAAPLILLGMSHCAVAQEPAVVEELLQLDTQAALHAARQNVIGSMTVPGPVTSLSSSPTAHREAETAKAHRG